eukprot:TRINITY_DN2724_c0_g1_i1.p1 TRINITY_DN2724_c0_g1~~TRINITY_DN2724_c0_g1_i1.p1  ORF type:complete len:145 (-),score=34.00 TRINITY_DN2724_c0_g1_i1:389-823(-)
MIYLHSRRIVHRDLAARNLLVDKNYVIKVADFGLSEAAVYYNLDQSAKMPIRWTAPEALKRQQFITASDVYSFGCVLHEMFAGGDQPWDTLFSNSEVKQAVCAGERMSKPVHCPDDIYDLMCECWHFNPKERPTMTDVLEKVNL